MVDVERSPRKDLLDNAVGHRQRPTVGYDDVDSGRGVGRSEPVMYDESFKSEEKRLQTFNCPSWPSFSGWPAGHSVTPGKLAAAGLYYTGVDDNVRCAFCFHSLWGWAPADDPLQEHRRLYPDCPFVSGAPVGNVPIHHGASHQSGPVHPELADMQSRAATFTRPATLTRNIPPVSSLAEAGFYLDGSSSTSTICFWCGGSLRSWSAGENPWMEHARWFPDCGFVRAQKGEDYIAAAVALFGETEQPQGLYYTAAQAAESQDPRPSYDIAPGDEGIPMSQRLEQRSPWAAALDLLDAMGYSREVVHWIADRERERKAKHMQPMNADEILREAASFVRMQQLSGAAPPPQPLPGSDWPTLALTENGYPVAQATPDVDQMETEESLQQISSGSSDVLICTICHLNARQRALLPCRHFVCCEECAADADKCPICGCDVSGTYRVYVS